MTDQADWAAALEAVAAAKAQGRAVRATLLGASPPHPSSPPRPLTPLAAAPEPLT